MEIRRATFGAAIRLALVLSVVAALATVVLSAVGEVSTIGLVTAVSLIGFTTSWVQTGRVARTTARHGHRVTVLSLH